MRRLSLMEKIDNYLSTKKPSEQKIIYFSIFLILFVLSYQYLFPYTEKIVKRSENQKREIQRKINEDKNYIASITVNGDKEFIIKSLQKDIKKLKKEFTNIKHNNEYLDFQIHTLSNLLYNEKNWAKFLDSIAAKAKKHNININFISNEFVKNSKNFGHVLEIEIGCDGEFKNLIGFINSIEQSELVVDIYGMDLTSKADIETNLKVSVWGINY
ncbi:type 4a pilus biogenesis protein PilO [Nitrosophilus kaiyonis]|uniref:type 4a pilus biogenesis protein PilO n=1 Tax=Nitrosophilus kaiyonis TaxID=2930200 RepID=UPI00248F7ABC|nr:type 4a pilus biogenesis protein PilO [Nitrosophilus kaiyonis]